MPDATFIGDGRGTKPKRADREPRSIADDEAFDAAALAEKLRLEADSFLKGRPADAEPRAFK